ncbi:helix-turn-helix domain-containing protein [Micromonospora lupini]
MRWICELSTHRPSRQLPSGFSERCRSCRRRTPPRVRRNSDAGVARSEGFAMLLREHRGDGHITAFVAHGIDGLRPA